MSNTVSQEPGQQPMQNPPNPLQQNPSQMYKQIMMNFDEILNFLFVLL